MKRILGIISLVVGLIMLVATFAIHASQVKETTVKLSTSAAESTVFVYVDSGVLTLVNDQVRVTLDSPDNDIQWALGSPIDVAAYIGQAPAEEISGMESWKELTTSTEEGTPEGIQTVAEAVTAQSFNLVGSDMWSQTGEGKSETTIEFDSKDLDSQTFLATTAQGEAPKVTLEWIGTREISSPVVYYVIASLLALIGSFLLLNSFQERQLSRPHKRTAVKLRTHAHQDSATSVIGAFDGDIADPSVGREVQRTYTGSAFGASILPSSARIEMFRNRELAEEDRILLSDGHDGETHSMETASGIARQAEHEASGIDINDDAEENKTVVEAGLSENFSGHETVDSMEQKIERNGNDWRSLWNFS
ncbi:hypothetical protein JTE88_01835 [Arcanobacterium phocisimile]|uniref:DUF5305 domain-containing protein n=1 Tax=Arcanobacterium phocisimile TaxID=1302235 RepID=A0ABX7IIF9_9ACTO|nr:hypothetical protein [Arcanobacterium phocisimile]QRV02520.1 hypothetical protein JTE88_01835 [Arcanobacterium phocisimile]